MSALVLFITLLTLQLSSQTVMAALATEVPIDLKIGQAAFSLMPLVTYPLTIDRQNKLI